MSRAVLVQRRTGLAIFAAIVSFSAFAGMIGLVTGAIGIGPVLTARLPFGSAVFGGIALALIVGVPTASVALLAWRGDERADRTAVFAGGCVIGWIVVQMIIIRELSFFHPTYLAVGAVFVWIGRRALRQPSTL